jgi:uncharacterized protein RhaS with RHS repeats
VVGRYYDPTSGQFISVDPDVASTGEPYAFAGSDPVNSSDPSGLILVGSNEESAPFELQEEEDWIAEANVVATTGKGAADAVFTEGLQIRGNFPRTAGPDSVLYRANSSGVTNYELYDMEGLPIIRADFEGSAHFPFGLPHVHEFTRNIDSYGVEHVNTGPVRAATPDEILSESDQALIAQSQVELTRAFPNWEPDTASELGQALDWPGYESIGDATVGEPAESDNLP